MQHASCVPRVTFVDPRELFLGKVSTNTDIFDLRTLATPRWSRVRATATGHEVMVTLFRDVWQMAVIFELEVLEGPVGILQKFRQWTADLGVISERYRGAFCGCQWTTRLFQGESSIELRVLIRTELSTPPMKGSICDSRMKDCAAGTMPDSTSRRGWRRRVKPQDLHDWNRLYESVATCAKNWSGFAKPHTGLSEEQD